jgi:replicative DNA helicase
MLLSPAEASSAYVAYAQKIQAWPGVRWGVPSLDRAIIPMRPGDVVGIIARPGHGKSTLMAYLARHTAQDIVKRGSTDRECVVYCTFEQSCEEIETFFEIEGDTYSASDLAWGKVDIDTVIKGAVKRIALPVWMMGKSMIRRGQIPRMTVENVYRALEMMEADHKIKPSLIILDYIQIIPIDKAAERNTQVADAINRAKTDLAMNVGCPVVFGVQAGRDVDKRASKIPISSDCQWASEIEQAADKLIGIWRPCLTEDVKTVQVNKTDYSVTPELLVAKLLKQRGEQAGQTFALHFAPQWIRLSDIELRQYEGSLT